jgi:hypothetical protein
MSRSIWIFVLCVLFLGAGDAAAGKRKKHHEHDRSCWFPKESVCDKEKGTAKALCYAYCDALKCGSLSSTASSKNKTSTEQACAWVKTQFEKMTARPLPCAVGCTCPTVFPLFAEVTSGNAPIAACYATEDLIWVVTESGGYVLVDALAPACSVNGEPPFHELTAAEQMACRVALQTAAAAQGVPCVHPE